MEDSKFDDLAKRIASGSTRRGLFRGLAAGLGGAVASLPLLGGDAEAKKAKKAKKAAKKARRGPKADKAKKAPGAGKAKKALKEKRADKAAKLKAKAQGKDNKLESQRCAPNGQVCKSANPQRPARLGCGRCCSRYSVKAGQGRKCACVPTGIRADNRSQCCTGFLRAGRCAERRPT